MKKSTVIATCLPNSRMIDTIDHAEFAVESIFVEEFPKSSFIEWNTQINDKVATKIIATVGRASMINVKKFIEDLSDAGQDQIAGDI